MHGERNYIGEKAEAPVARKEAIAVCGYRVAGPVDNNFAMMHPSIRE